MQIAVLGAGITGLAAAEWLRRDGHGVTLVDRVRPGDPAQASYGNAGLLAAGSVGPVAMPGLAARAPGMLLDPDGPLFLKWRYLPRLLPWLVPFLRAGREAEVRRIAGALGTLVRDSTDQHQALAAGTGADRYLGAGGYVTLYRDRAGFEADPLEAALRREAALAWDAFDRAALAERDPALGQRYQFGVRYHDAGWITDPGRYLRALFAHFRAGGGLFRQGPVEDARPAEPGVTVRVGGETLEYDRAVIAMGAWSGELARRLGHRPRLESERGYHLVLEGASVAPPGPYLLSDAKFGITPMEDGLRLAGLVEFGGLEAGPSAAPTRLQRRHIARVFPGIRWAGEQLWMGHRPTTADSLPHLGQSPKTPGILFAFGGQHLGLTMGPKSGRLIADLIAGRVPNIDLAPFRPDRFDAAS